MEAPNILPQEFDEVKQERVEDLITGFQLGVYTKEDKEVVKELRTLIDEKVAHRIKMMIAYN